MIFFLTAWHDRSRSNTITDIALGLTQSSQCSNLLYCRLYLRALDHLKALEYWCFDNMGNMGWEYEGMHDMAIFSSQYLNQYLPASDGRYWEDN